MGFFDIFKKKKKHPDFDPSTDLVLSKIKPGFFTDYDMKTWEVSTKNYYDYGNNDIVYEWQLKGFDETIYLEKESDDEDRWTISRKIPLSKIDKNIIKQLSYEGDTPENITVDGKTYYFDEQSGGHFYKNCCGTGEEFIAWCFLDEDENISITIEQWGENSFESSQNLPVKEYQFTNILPGKLES